MGADQHVAPTTTKGSNSLFQRMDTKGRLAASVLETETKTQEVERLNSKVASYKQKIKHFKQALNEDSLRLDLEIKKAETLLEENKILKATVLKHETGIR